MLQKGPLLGVNRNPLDGTKGFPFVVPIHHLVKVVALPIHLTGTGTPLPHLPDTPLQNIQPAHQVRLRDHQGRGERQDVAHGDLEA